MNKIASELRHAASQVSTKSFLNPLLWLCGVISIPAFAASLLAQPPLQLAFFCVGLIPIVLCSFMVVKYRNRPELFQSEEYRLKDHALRVYGEKNEMSGDAIAKIVDTHSITIEDLRERMSDV